MADYGIICGMRKYVIPIALIGALACAAALAKNTSRLAATKSVPRCQAVLDDGKQCENEADPDTKFCWRHRGAAKAVGDAAHGAGEGMKSAWTATKAWSTNAWEATKQGVGTAVDATKDAAESARVGIVELFGGVDAPKDAKKKSGKSK